MAKHVEFLLAVEKVAKVLGYTAFKDEQKVVLEKLLKTRDVFAILPTGYGKPVLFQSSFEIFRKELSMVVVTPFMAIMKDQVRL